MHVVHSDMEAYEHLQKGLVTTVIADIDSIDLGGLAVLSYCHHNYPAIKSYAITLFEDGYRKKLARELGGCSGFFHLLRDSLKVDLRRGMAALLSTGISGANIASNYRIEVR